MEEEEEHHHHHQQHHWQLMNSPEIVEISDDGTGNRNIGLTTINDVYVAVGKNDLHVVKWALDHAVSPGTQVFLVHVFQPMTYINTPVGRLARSQLSNDQARAYVNEDRNKRKNLLEKYIRLCNDSKVAVDTILLESNTTAKTILDLIPIVNITNLVMGTKRSPFIRQLRRGQGKGEYVQKNAPDFCKVTLVYNGQKVENGPLQPIENFEKRRRPETTPHNFERNFFECMCFSGKSN
ncbi:OLC1v1013208C4 [Oldenlandia corymbosa var. corymbosa]|nr:OLC1v1013208C4 [Oldenlandia corymbosa var. corymbosa]